VVCFQFGFLLCYFLWFLSLQVFGKDEVVYLWFFVFVWMVISFFCYFLFFGNFEFFLFGTLFGSLLLQIFFVYIFIYPF
jgi:hypothetical protein